MLADRRGALLTISFVLLLSLFLSGCVSQNDGGGTATTTTTTADPLASCGSRCASQFPHSVGRLNGSTCTCPCEDGYVRHNGVCISAEDYTKFAPADCDARCAQSIPRSAGLWKDGNCTCPCEKGYFSYNRTCITSQELERRAPLLCSPDHPVLKYYDWTYKGVNSYIYLCYASKEAKIDPDRSGRTDYWNFVDDPYSNGSVALVTGLLTNISRREGLSPYGQVEFAIAFVQSLPYTYDNVTTPYDDYPRFPWETIYADGGDCEDTSILMAAVLERMGYGVVLLRLPRHVAVGVACTPSDFHYNVTAYTYNGREYCYLETTGENYKIGQLPADLGFTAATEVKIIPLRAIQPDLYIKAGYRYASTRSDSRYTYIDVTGIRVDNYGTATAKNVKINVALDAATAGQVWSQYALSPGDMVSGAYYNGNVTNLRVPTGEQFKVGISVYGDNFKTATSETAWATWS